MKAFKTCLLVALLALLLPPCIALLVYTTQRDTRPHDPAYDHIMATGTPTPSPTPRKQRSRR